MQPICVAQRALSSTEHARAAPLQLTPDHAQPLCAVQAMLVVRALHGAAVPPHEPSEHPSSQASAERAVQAVGVPPHEPPVALSMA
jgi:hypothetical protein